MQEMGPPECLDDCFDRLPLIESVVNGGKIVLWGLFELDEAPSWKGTDLWERCNGGNAEARDFKTDVRPSGER